MPLFSRFGAFDKQQNPKQDRQFRTYGPFAPRKINVQIMIEARLLTATATAQRLTNAAEKGASRVTPYGVPSERVGIWLLGARGSVATTAALGLAAVAEGLAPMTGLVTETSAFSGVRLPALRDLVIGGADLSDESLRLRATRLAEGGVVPYDLLAACAPALDAVEERLRPGVRDEDCLLDPSGAVAAVQRDLEQFRREQGLARVVVVQLTPTEASPAPEVALLDEPALACALSGVGPDLPPSVVYACAALAAGCAFVDFTPSVSTTVPGVQQRARAAGLPLVGRDGKTGETLLKAALAPMFVDRALAVQAWTGTNLLGGGDGSSLADPARRRTKLVSKAVSLEAILGPQLETTTSIAHVATLGEWKTAWDHIVFDGWLGTRMRLQFTWEGCDSSLAAPLVLDLARLVALGMAAGARGPVPELGYFFKDPVGCDEHRLAQQFDALRDWAMRLSDMTYRAAS